MSRVIKQFLYESLVKVSALLCLVVRCLTAVLLTGNVQCSVTESKHLLAIVRHASNHFHSSISVCPKCYSGFFISAKHEYNKPLQHLPTATVQQRRQRESSTARRGTGPCLQAWPTLPAVSYPRRRLSQVAPHLYKERRLGLVCLLLRRGAHKFRVHSLLPSASAVASGITIWLWKVRRITP